MAQILQLQTLNAAEGKAHPCSSLVTSYNGTACYVCV
ncbi:hypothetical protein SAMN05216275_117115 [Streptosporangium canum]|uniref:Uncharacterized protein n=1 Tax=Streptosporangium canum TaxID=324952 RepID=A0A1I3WSQ3_9ACTN|nr:hypothetical protein SAMN05216275_117115 [Streptosporangium canum]